MSNKSIQLNSKCICDPLQKTNRNISTQTLDFCNKNLPELKDSEREKSLADDIREAAEQAMQSSGFVYEENSGLYYDYNSGYYYNAVRLVLCVKSQGCSLSFCRSMDFTMMELLALT